MLARRFDYVKELDRELAEHEKADPAWKSTAVANAVMTDITLQRSLTVNEAGDLARQRITRLVGELAQLIKRVIKIEIEILQGEKGQLEQEIVQEQQAAGLGQDHRRVAHRGRRRAPVLAVQGRVLARRARLLPRQAANNRCERTAPEGAPTGPTQ